MANNLAFFSYSRADSTFALKLAKDLRAAGVDLWIDQLDIKAGTHWDAAVEKALNASGCMILILSPEAIASNNVMDEVSYGLECGKTIIPILFKDCAPPFRLRRLQRIDFTSEYDTGFNYLLEALGQPAKREIINKKEQASVIEIEEQPKEEIIKTIPIPLPLKPGPVANNFIQDHKPPPDFYQSNVEERVPAKGFHNQRMLSLILSGITMIFMFLPWWDGDTKELSDHGFQSLGFGNTGFLTLTGIVGTIIIAFIGNKSKPYMGSIKIIAFALSAVISIGAIMHLMITVPFIKSQYNLNTSVGIGTWLSLIGGVVGLALVAGIFNKPSYFDHP